LNATKLLYEIRESIWLEGITRDALDGDLLRHILASGVASGLIFNPTGIEYAINHNDTYDTAIRNMLRQEIIGEDLFVELAIEDARQAADLMRPIYEQSNGAEGWVSMDVSPRAFDDTRHLSSAVKKLYARVGRPNVMLNVPGTNEGLKAVVEAVSDGVPVNITHLFSAEQFAAATEAYLKGAEQRIGPGVKPDSCSAVSLNMRRWDSEHLKIALDTPGNPLGVAIFQCIYNRWRAIFQSPRWERASRGGARPLHLLCMGIGSHTPEKLKALTANTAVAPLTVFTMRAPPPDRSTGDGSRTRQMPTDPNEGDTVISRFVGSGGGIDALADQFQNDAVSSFVNGWCNLLTAIACKSATLIQVK